METLSSGAVDIDTEGRCIVIKGLITFGTYAAVAAALYAFQNRTARTCITIIIKDSPGGDLLAALMMYSLMKGSVATVYTVAEGKIASAAVIVFLGGSKRCMVRGSQLVTHRVARMTDQDFDIVTVAELFAELSIYHKLLVKLYSSGFRVSKQKAETLNLFINTISTKQALRMGFATGIMTRRTFKKLCGLLQCSPVKALDGGSS